MKPTHYQLAGMVAVLVVFGCQSLPNTTKTGRVIEVPIVNSEKIDDVAVHRGDEVRWVNKRRAPVRVVLIDPELDKRVSCSNHFGGFMKPRDTAELMTNQSASICFNEEGLFKYVVRMDSTRETGEINVPGTIKVGEQGG